MEDYYWTMAARHRLVTVQVGGSVSALCTFFVLPDASSRTIRRYYDRPCWSLLPDDAEGSVIYVDKLVSYVSWSPHLFHAVEAAVTQQIPQWQTAIWYRPTLGADRRYTYRRRRWPDG